MAQKPVAISLLFCEQVIVEEATRNVTPVNCFTFRAVNQFPSLPLPFVVLAWLTDGMGDVEISIAIQRLDDLDEIYARKLMVHFSSPLQEARCMLRIRDCSFPVPGQYEVTLQADDEPLARRKLHVFLAEESQ